MSQNIETWFSELFQADVKLAYQRMGSKLRNTVRTKNGCKGSLTYFDKAGTVTVGPKARDAHVPVIGVGRVPCELDWVQCSDVYVEDLDEIQTMPDEKLFLAESLAAAHGRYTDKIIIDAMDSASPDSVGSATGVLGVDTISEAFATLNEKDVPDDGTRTAIVCQHIWERLLTFDEFASADFIGSNQLPWLNGRKIKVWRNTRWIVHSGLPVNTDSATTNYIYHPTAIGPAIGHLKATWSW